MSRLPLWHAVQLGDEMVERVVEEMLTKETVEATMNSDGSRIDFEARKTKVHFAEPGYWLEGIFERFAMEANKVCKWNYHITGTELLQFAAYGVGDHYTWHYDTFVLDGLPEDRKVSVVCLLNDEFEGGDFEICLYGRHSVNLKKGTMIAFPSILEHRVTPVVSGTRYSATMWFNGPRFR